MLVLCCHWSPSPSSLYHQESSRGFAPRWGSLLSFLCSQTCKLFPVGSTLE
jgi:hypothetical protein